MTVPSTAKRLQAERPEAQTHRAADTQDIDQYVTQLARRLPARLKHLATRENLVSQPASGISHQAREADAAYQQMRQALLTFETLHLQESSAQERAFFSILHLAMAAALQAPNSNMHAQLLAAHAWFEKHKPARRYVFWLMRSLKSSMW